MSKNKVQFQKGMSLSDFMASYGDEHQCREAVFQARWPNGFLCPECGYAKYCEIRGRNCFQCYSCHHQTSLLSGTIYGSVALSVFHPNRSLISLKKNCRELLNATEPTLVARLVHASVQTPPMPGQLLKLAEASW